MLRTVFLAVAIFCSFAFVGVLASPSTGGHIAEKIKSGLNSIFVSNAAAEPVAYGTDSVINISSFHWLDPIAPSSGDPSKFDPSLLNGLEVDVCQVNGVDCTLFKTFTVQGTTSEQLRIVSNGSTSYYVANWDTSKVKLNDKTYRITVMLAGLQLGSIDLAPSVYTRFGRTWPIKFLIEKDPVLRVRYLHSLGRTAAQVLVVLNSEFGLCGQDAAALLAGDLEPYSNADIDLAVQGVCQNAIIPPTTKISDEDTRNSLMTYDPSTGIMFFAVETPVLKNLKTGDVLVSEPSAAAPYGFLRKITSIRKNMGQYTIGTAQAKLNEAVSQGTLKASGELLPEQISSASSGLSYVKPTEDADSNKGLSALDVGDGFNFHRDIDVTIDLSATDPDASGSGNVHVVGSLDFNASYDLGAGVETCAEIPPVCVDRVEAHVDVNQKSNIRVTGQFDGMVHKEKKIDALQFAPITFFIGPIPVVIVPTIDIVVGVDGQAHADFVFAANANSTLKVGAKWTDPGDGGVGWENIHDFQPLSGGVTESTLNADLTVDGYGKANAKLLLYDVAGPGMAARVGLLAHVQIGHKPLWTIYGHIVGDVNFSVDIADIIDLGNYSSNVLDESFEIGEAANQAPIFSNVNTGVIEANVSTPVFLGPRAGGIQGYFDCSDPEGEQVSYSVSSDVDGPLSGLSPTFQTSGQRIVTIVASDPEGATSSIMLTIDVRNALPVVTIYATTYTVPKTVQYFITATAYDPESGSQNPANGFLTCDHIDFSVSSPDTYTKTGSAGTCGATIIFNAEGQRTVTVNATDPNGGVGTASITVNVTPEPTNHPPVINSFNVYAYRGPFSIYCPDPNYYCVAPDNAILYNGQVGDYYPPLLLDVGATDPDGTQLSVQWHCTTGTQEAPIGYNAEYDFPSCDPIYSSVYPITVYAVISDGVNTINSPSRTYHMLSRVN